VRFHELLSDMAETGAIIVWRYYDAPTEWQELSEHGGDEDWLAVVPARMADDYIGWLGEGGPFGCCSVSRHELADGRLVFIGAHA